MIAVSGGSGADGRLGLGCSLSAVSCCLTLLSVFRAGSKGYAGVLESVRSSVVSLYRWESEEGLGRCSISMS